MSFLGFTHIVRSDLRHRWDYYGVKPEPGVIVHEQYPSTQFERCGIIETQLSETRGVVRWFDGRQTEEELYYLEPSEPELKRLRDKVASIEEKFARLRSPA